MNVESQRGGRSEMPATAQLAAIVQSSHDAIIGKDLHGVITSWNPAAERLYGYRRDEVMHRPSRMLVHPDHRDSEAAMMARIVNGQHVAMFPTRRVHKSGAVLQVSLSASPIVDTDNLIVGVSTASRDVGEVAVAQAWFHGLLAAAPDATICVNADGDITLVNDQVQRLFGYPRAELIGQPIEMLLPAAARAAHPRLRRGYAAAPTNRQMGGESQLSGQRKDGTTFPADVSLSSTEIGGVLVIMATARDVTDRVAAHTALAQSEARFRELADNIDVGFALRSLHPPEFLYISPAFEKIYGYHPTSTREDPAVGLQRLTHPQDWDRIRTGYWANAKNGIPDRAEFRIIRPGGDERWIRATSTPVPDPDGVVRRTASTVEDITDIKLAETAQLAATAAAKANAAKNEFLSRMSHELRTPLNAVLGFAQLLELENLTSDQKDAVRHILRGGHHLVSLIDDVLDIAKIESERMDLSLEAVPIAELLTETVQLMGPMAAAANITLTHHPATAHPATDPAHQHAWVDRRRLRQVVLNLLSNAIKYNRPGGHVDISCTTTQNPPQLNITVTDTGLGIRAADLPRLFTPFDRLGAATTGIEGTGVGLALSQRLMTVMDGSLHATSQPGTGSTFTATIPQAPRPAPPTKLPPHTNPHHHPSHPNPPQRAVLYIEDNNSNIQLMEHLLNRRPHWHMTVAGHGNLGIELATTNPPDLILLDLHLPDMDGIEVLHQLKKNPTTAAIPTIVISADANPHQIERLLTAGADKYLTKPLEVGQVLQILDTTPTAHSPTH